MSKHRRQRQKRNRRAQLVLTLTKAFENFGLTHPQQSKRWARDHSKLRGRPAVPALFELFRTKLARGASADVVRSAAYEVANSLGRR